MSHDDFQPEDLALWQHFRGKPAAESPVPIDPAVLAAYLEGRLNASDSDRLEALLAENPRLLSTWLELVELHEAGCMLAPRRVLERATALKSGAAPPSGTFHFRRWALAAAWLLAAGIGWQAGLGTALSTPAPEAPLALEQVFDLEPDALVLEGWMKTQGVLLP